MPLFDNGIDRIRANLEEIQKGNRPHLVSVGALTGEQLSAINQNHYAGARPPIIDEVVFIGRHVFESRIVRDGYTIDDVIDQISSAMSATAVIVLTPYLTAMENPNRRADRYGNVVRDRAVFECSARHPRSELFLVVSKGDTRNPERPLK
jgi:hypothetical protein